MNAPLHAALHVAGSAGVASAPSPIAPLFAALLAHRTRLMRVALRILHSPHLAEEVVEDAAVKLCEAEGVLEVGNPVPFLFRLVRNLSIDRARRLKRERSLAGSAEEAELVPMPGACPLERLEQREMLGAVIEALAALPPRTRFAFLRHRLDGMPQKDIAEVLGVSRTLVNFMVRDATKACRESVEGSCVRRRTPCPLAARGARSRRAGAKVPA